MPTSIASGTQTADGSEDVLATDTSNKNYVLVVDLSNLVNGETVVLKLYAICLSGGALVLAYFATYSNAQAAPLKYSIPVPADVKIEATLQQTVYVSSYKSFPWKLLSLG